MFVSRSLNPIGVSDVDLDQFGVGTVRGRTHDRMIADGGYADFSTEGQWSTECLIPTAK
ncbi:MAG: hypothetical protein GY948_21845 [Alphaproteobacteria bacterium]|nr:hypothetical protein [Alphaproteobacteria bacterium]